MKEVKKIRIDSIAVDGTYYMHITIDGEDYSGVFCQMKDEAGTDVMTFSAVGGNQSVWGVKYIAE